MNDPGMRQLFGLCKDKNRFVFEVSDIFGDKLGIEEVEYWFVYNVIVSASIYDADIKGMSFESALQEIEKAERKRRTRWQKKGKSTSKKLT